MSRQTVIAIVATLGFLGLLVGLAMVSPEVARVLGLLLRLVGLIARAFG
ncbi:MAG: hypothetical protein KDK12_02330 [Rhodobacteraceae bacterium]|nr:hypothetical protein [Paracoccaceae bacterium]